MRQAEKALREAGWEEVPGNEAQVGDEVYDLEEHEVYVVDAVSSLACSWRVLRAPRPEPEYEPGTVVWGRILGRDIGDQAFIRQDDDEYPWVGVDNLCYTQSAWRDDFVEVIRVIAYPDGPTPKDQTESDRNALIEGMVPRVAEYWYNESRIIKYVSPYETTPPEWGEADDATRESWKRETRDVLLTEARAIWDDGPGDWSTIALEAGKRTLKKIHDLQMRLADA